MASKRTQKRTDTADPAQPVRPPVASSERTDYDANDPLASLRSAHVTDRISITRSWPPQAAGWLDDVELPAGGIDDLPELIRSQYGGGRYQLQLKRKKPGVPGVPFTNICAQLQVAGTPRDPRAEAERAPQPMPAPVVIQGPPGSTDQSNQLLGLVIEAVRNGGGGATNLAELAKVILQATSVSQQRSNPLEGLEQMLGLWAKFRTVFAPNTDREPERESSPLSGLLGGMGGGQLEQLLLAKFLGGMGGGQPQPAPQIPPPPSPRHVFHPQHGWFIPTTSKQEQKPAAAQQPAPPQPPPASPPPRPHLVETYDDEPLTADEIADDIDQLSEAEQDKLLERLMQAKLGKMDPAIVQKVMAGAGGGVSLDDSYPMAADGE